MGGVIGISRGHAHEQILEILAGQQIAVAQRFLAEIGQQRIARMVDLDRIELRLHFLGIAARGELALSPAGVFDWSACQCLDCVRSHVRTRFPGIPKIHLPRPCQLVQNSAIRVSRVPDPFESAGEPQYYHVAGDLREQK
ncbi:hypothetical protein D9M73_117440 [compost metagenome]